MTSFAVLHQYGSLSRLANRAHRRPNVVNLSLRQRTNPLRVDPSIFKAYDIRGTYPDQLDVGLAYALGRAFATYLSPERVIVGRDMRLSGPQLHVQLLLGLRKQGVDVLDLGEVSTDQYYFACATHDLPGLMITASHNPPHYNGFKMVRRMPYLLSGDDGIGDLRRIIETESYPPASKTGTVESADVSAGFVQRVLKLIDPKSLTPLRVVADTGNGMVGPILEQVYRHLPIKLAGMNLEPNGNPHHGLDPMQEENRIELQRCVVREGADLGFAFDGDGDRFFVIDDRGRFVPGDFVTALLACHMLGKHPGSKIVYDVRCSWAVRDTVEAAGGTALMERVGHAFLKPRMASEGAVFAGELSGHYYFREFFGADSGVVPSLFLLEMLALKGQPLSSLLAPLEQSYFITGEINSTVEDPAEKIESIARTYRDGMVERLDGISVSYEDWHFNLRPSNTEPLLRLNLEALNPSTMATRRDELLAHIQS